MADIKELMKINDISFLVGPRSISVQKENLSYKFQVLRENGGTKIPSGHGMAVAHLSIPIPPQDLLKLHRLLIQIKRNPFVFVENRLLRQQLVPHWSLEQNMAFTISNGVLQTTAGSPNLFNLELTLQFFNYRPFAENFLFREDWVSEDIEGPTVDWIYNKTIYGRMVNLREKPHSWKAPDLKKPLMENWAGGFHATLTPQIGMKKANAVSDPARSRIYVRYYNELQKQALVANFGINVDLLLGADNQAGTKSTLDECDKGFLSIEKGLENLGLLEGVTRTMLSYDYWNLGFNIYKIVPIPDSLKSQLGASINNMIEGLLKIEEQKSAPVVIGGAPASLQGDAELVRQYIPTYHKLVEEGHPDLTSAVTSVFTDLIKGNTLSGLAYPENYIVAREVARKDASYGSKTSPHLKRPSEAIDVNFILAPYFNHNCIESPDSNRNIIEDYNVAQSFSKDSTEYKDWAKRFLDGLMNRIFFIDMGRAGLFQNLDWGGRAGAVGYPIHTGNKNVDPSVAVAIHKWTQQTIFNLSGVSYTLPGGAQITFDNENFTLADLIKKIRNVRAVVVGTLPQIDIDGELAVLIGDGTKLGSDQVHLGLRSGNRNANAPATPYTYSGPSTVSINDGIGGKKVKTYSEALEALSRIAMTSDDIEYLAMLSLLKQQGWVYYEENSTTGVFFKRVEITLPTASGFENIPSYRSYIVERQDNLTNGVRSNSQNTKNLIYNGSKEDFDTILTACSYSLRHLITTLPIAGSQYPSAQHIGSLDGTYHFEMITQDRGEYQYETNKLDLNSGAIKSISPQKRDGVGMNALLIEYALSTLQENGRTIRNIYDSWMCDVDCFFTRLTGIYREELSTFRQDRVGIQNLDPMVRKLVVGASNLQTLPHGAGLSAINIEMEESKPFIMERLAPAATSKREMKESIYKKLTEKILSTTVSSQKKDARLAFTDLRNAILIGATVANVVPNPLGILISPATLYGLYATTTITIPNSTLKIDSPNRSIFTLNGGQGLPDLFDPDPNKILDRLNKIGKADQESLDKVIFFIRRALNEVIAAQYLFVEEGESTGGISLTNQDMYGYERVITPQFNNYATIALNSSTIWMAAYFFGWLACFFEDITRSIMEVGVDIYKIIGDLIASPVIPGANPNEFNKYILKNWLTPSEWDSFKTYPPYARMLIEALFWVLRKLYGIIVWVLDQLDWALFKILNLIVNILSLIIDGAQAILNLIALPQLLMYNLILNLSGITEGLEHEFPEAFKELGLSGALINRHTFKLISAEFLTLDLQLSLPYSQQAGANFYSNNVEGMPAVLREFKFDLQNTGERFGIYEAFLKKVDEIYRRKPAEILTTIRQEENKVQEFRNAISGLYDEVFSSTLLSEYFGVRDEASAFLNAKQTDKNEAMPDLRLPGHPLLGLATYTPPDFYYWNPYEDGSYKTIEAARGDFTKQVQGAIAGVSDFMNKMKLGDINKAALNGTIEVETGATQFDGSDNVMSQEFNASGEPPNAFSNDNPVETLRLNPKGNGLYPVPIGTGSSAVSERLMKSTDDLIREIGETEFLLGKKEGFTTEEKKLREFFGDKADTKLSGFSRPTLESITMEAAKDLYSQTTRMRGAFPVVRLYIVDEDDDEDFLTKWDDFHHYNAIKEVTIVRNREVAADTAVITLQNISGTLDGNKRLTIRDVDYLSENRTVTGEFTSTGQETNEYRKNQYQETDQEERFNSVVLRPGTNMQIRTGYSNNPEELEVKMSGRITDINKSANGDLIEIIVQSFAVELEQQIKGLDQDVEERIFTMTHKLLGSLMFEPEVKHFGRWEKYTSKMRGEDKSHEFDLSNYSFSSFGPIGLFNLAMPVTSENLSLWWRRIDKAFEHLSNGEFLKAAGSGFGGTWNATTLAPKILWDIAWLIPRAGLSVPNSILSFFDKEITYNSAKFLAKPQDDNIFAPNPLDYLYRDIPEMRKIEEWLSTIANPNNTMKVIYGKQLKEMANKKRFLMTSQDLEYRLRNVTIWQVFKEMTLRHPGYAYAAVPYGKEFRYTMFFGLPSQRYWSRPGSNLMIETANDGRALLEREEISVGWKALTRSILGSWHIDNKLGLGSRTRPTTVVPSNEEKAATLEKLKKRGINSEEEALTFYLEAMAYRFEPFRRYHLATSGRNIILNTIGQSSYEGANTIAVKYYDEYGEAISDYEIVKIHEALPDELVKMKTIDFSQCKGKDAAMRYGIGSLIYEAKKSYTGELLLMGNPRIKPWDIVMIIDSYNDMCGPIEVEQVIERISFESGYITEIKPNMVVFANEVSSLPVLEGAKTIAAFAAKQHNHFNFEKFDIGNKGLENIWAKGVYNAANPYNEYIVRSIPGLGGVSQEEGKLGAAINLTAEVSGVSLETMKAKSFSNYLQYKIQEETGLNLNLLDSKDRLASVFNSGIGLLGGYLYVMKSSRRHPIIAYPLLKNGNPMNGIIPAGYPDSLFAIFKGQVSTWAQDVAKGTSDLMSYWKTLGLESIDTTTNIIMQIIKDSTGGTQ